MKTNHEERMKTNHEETKDTKENMKKPSGPSFLRD